MIGCNLSASFPDSSGNLVRGDTTLENTDFTRANLTGAIFDGAGGRFTIFTDARLDHTSWGPGVVTVCNRAPPCSFMFVYATVILQGNFRNASLQNSTLSYVSLDYSDFQGVTIAGTDFSTPLWIQNASHLPFSAPIKSTSCIQCILSTDKAIRDTNFNGVDLTFAVLAHTLLDNVQMLGTVLTGADFTGVPTTSHIVADLRGDLTGTNFSGFDFAGLDLSHLDLSAAIFSADTNFVGAILSDGVTHGVNLAGHVFPEGTTQFRGQNLAYANLSGVQLVGADLAGANLTEAVLVGANLNFVNLQHATLQRVRAGVAPGTQVHETTLRGAYMPNANLTDADLRSADLTAAHIYGDLSQSLLVRTKLDSANLTDALLANTAFSGTLNDTVFTHAVLVNATFNGATLTNAKFDVAYLQGASFAGASSTDGTVFTNAAFSTDTQCLAGSDTPKPPCAWTYTEQSGKPVIVSYGPTILGAVATDLRVVCPNGNNGGCVGQKLVPKTGGPYPPRPACVPVAPGFCNCIPQGQPGSCAPE